MTIINVGAVALRNPNSHGYGSVEESVTVGLSETWIEVQFHTSAQPGVAGLNLDLTAEQAIELGQMLLKAAEVQPKYAEEAKQLREEQAKLGGKYKDMISGLGLEVLNDRLDDDGSLKIISA